MIYLVFFPCRDKIIQLSLNLEVLQQVDSFDVNKNTTCHENIRNKVSPLSLSVNVCCVTHVWPRSKVD